jgi:hypothetical protein
MPVQLSAQEVARVQQESVQQVAPWGLQARLYAPEQELQLELEEQMPLL